MCGIVGMAGNLYNSHNKMFKNMLLFDVVRGQDSTGVLTVGMGMNNPQLDVVKEVGHPGNLWDYGSTMFDGKGVVKGIKKAMLGHNRAATFGEVNRENAHPFEFDGVVGVHNGTIFDYRELEDSNHSVDSFSIYSNINKSGIKDTWGKFRGAAALAFWDVNEETMNFIRNDERTLFYCVSKNDDAIFWASESWMIIIAAQRSNVDLKMGESGKKPLIYSFKENTHYKFKVTNNNYELLSKEVLEGKKYVPVKTNYGTRCGNVYDGYKKYRNTGITHNNRSRSRKNKKGKVISSRYWAKGTEKGGKDIRGKLFTVESYKFPSYMPGGDEYFLCNFLVGSDIPLEVIPLRVDDQKNLSKYCGSDTTFKLTARPRAVVGVDGVIERYRVCSSHIRMIRDNVIPLEKKEPKGGESGFHLYNRLNVTEEVWSKQFDKAGSMCTCCGNPLDIDDAKSMIWWGEVSIACSDCQKDEQLMSQLYYMH